MKLVKVISTGRSVHLPKGMVVELPEGDAQILVNKGAAYYEGQEPKEKAEQGHTPKHEIEVEPTKKRTRRK